ncbi:pyruvate kinase [Pseudobacteriovorax antillogorgiicola]|uniref:Pyruvate kinase n=1 Tax=Pseudobacteriovorax antillogorgiicola TaxID=1513793 RepID=A0A1Y6BAG6_9BACT|nr:pyruvate kinase [Pseudobacteriovorax antillogorgiicola]TCS59227.1 pyruvate kinase [Pseudobacteriovorax antillogorgiicola]SME90354.1 Pyruvate kinase [Pseudobacteriovorax antillogorgiicola]
MLKQGRRTTVVWSFESSCLGPDLIETIRSQDVDAIRLSPEAGKMTHCLEFLESAKSSGALSERTPVLVDLYSQPRAIIKGGSDAGIEYKFGDRLTFSPIDGEGDFFIQTNEWDTLFNEGRSVYLGTGDVALKPVSISKRKVELEVVQGGRIFDEMEIHVPSTKTPVKFEDLPEDSWLATKSSNVDCVILPSFENAEDLKHVIKLIEDQEHHPWVLLKVGSMATYESLESLLPLVQGVVISRVELSMGMDPAKVPMLTKEAIGKCNRYAKLSLVASEMLGSMRHNATPTRAEVSDIGNAVFDGADGVVLSEDLAHGPHGVRGLELAKKTVWDVENSDEEPLNWQKYTPKVEEEIEAVTYAAYRAAYRNDAKAIVCITKMGNTALHLASFDIETPIIAVSLSKEAVRRLELVRGVEGVFLDELPPIDEVLPLINNMLLRDSWLKEGDKYVFVSVSISSLSREDSNLFTIQTLD